MSKKVIYKIKKQKAEFDRRVTEVFVEGTNGVRIEVLDGIKPGVPSRVELGEKIISALQQQQ